MRKILLLPKYIYIVLITTYAATKAALTEDVMLGDDVFYKGKVFGVSNGVARPCYALVRGIGTPEHEYHEYVDKKDFKVKHNITNYIRRFKSRFDFYRGYWWSIWLYQEKISKFSMLN